MSTAIYRDAEITESATLPRLVEVASVSVIIPCYNEERFIGKALANLAEQYWLENYEIIVVDGMSDDGTREVVEAFQQTHPDLSLRLLDNPERSIPHALNRGIAAAHGEIIARMDAHAAPSTGYIRRCVQVLGEGNAAVVGMPCRVRPGADTSMARAIAMAVSHSFGIGDAKYRLGSELEESDAQEEVDTVAFACFRKSLWSELNGFDEDLLTNEDYDFNYRTRARGGRVVLDRLAHCDYFARPTLAKLASQYFRYGAWKARMISRQPTSIKLRHVVAPAFVASLTLLTIGGFWRGIAWQMLALELATYVMAAVFFGFRAVRNNRASASLVLLMPLAFLTIHFSWGTSFLWGLFTPKTGNKRASR